MACPGNGFLGTTPPLPACKAKGLGPGGLALFAITELAEFDLGLPILGGGAICGPPPYGPGDMERGGPA